MKYHFIGVKGSGMSSLSILLKKKGEYVQGSDVNDYIFTIEELNKNNIKVMEFNKDNFDSSFVVIIGHSFINSDNEEVLKAKNENEYYEYNEFISEFIKNYYSIAISGSHGKTSTTSLISHMLNEVDECAYLIGDGTSNISSLSHYFVFEACEHQEHFLKYKSNVILINNIDYDHVDYYKSENDYIDAFYKFKDNALNKVIVNGDDKYLKNMDNCFRFGLNDDNDVVAKNIIEDEFGISYDVYYKNRYLERVTFALYGHHMVYNTLATIAVGLYLKLNIETIENGIKKFKNVKGRFNEIIYDECIFIDDYAHHHSEIKATINACKQKYPNKPLIAFFKGDRYSRIYKFAPSIASALQEADYAYVLPFPSCSKKEKNIDIDERYIKQFNDKIRIINEEEYKKVSSINKCVYLFMSSKNMNNEINKIIELKKENRKQ